MAAHASPGTASDRAERHPPLAARPDEPGVRVGFLCPSGPEPIGGVTAMYGYANALARRGHEVHLGHLPLWGRQVTGVDQLSRYHFEPSIVHHFHGDDVGDVAPPDIMFGTPGVESPGLPVLLFQGIDMLHERLERKALRTPCLKVCVASWLVEVGIDHGVPPEQLHVVPMGIDHDRYRVTRPLHGRPPTVAMLHSTHPAKGWPVGLEALHEVRRRVPDATAIVFGTSPPPDPLPEWVEVHVDPTTDALVDDVYNRARVFIQPSDYEGFGFTAVEAMACGAALVTTDNGGSDDYAREDETALLTEPGDGVGLGRLAAELLVDDDRRIRLAEAGRTLVRRFDWDVSGAELEILLERYLADPDHFRAPHRSTADEAVAGRG